MSGKACKAGTLSVILFVVGCSCFEGGGGCPSSGDANGDYWCSISAVGGPEAEVDWLIWTGSLVLALGRAKGEPAGARYDPATDTWVPMSGEGLVRGLPLWTGTDLLIFSTTGVQRYDVASDAWATLSTTSPAAPWQKDAVVWTGTAALGWGCDPASLETRGDRYDPEADLWTPISSAGGPGQIDGMSPTDAGCDAMAAVWTGSRAMLVNCAGEDAALTGTQGDFGSYDPQTDTWTAIGGFGDWCPNFGYRAVWTGEELILWGRAPVAYNPASGAFRDLASNGAPLAVFVMGDRLSCPAIWANGLMLVWGPGCDPVNGARYDPAVDSWMPIQSEDAPTPTSSIVWAGTDMVVWDGRSPGGRYRP